MKTLVYNKSTRSFSEVKNFAVPALPGFPIFDLSDPVNMNDARRHSRKIATLLDILDIQSPQAGSCYAINYNLTGDIRPRRGQGAALLNSLVNLGVTNQVLNNQLLERKLDGNRGILVIGQGHITYYDTSSITERVDPPVDPIQVPRRYLIYSIQSIQAGPNSNPLGGSILVNCTGSCSLAQARWVAVRIDPLPYHHAYFTRRDLALTACRRQLI